LQQLAGWGEDIDARGGLVLDLVGRILFVEASSDEQPTGGVELDAIGAAGGFPVVDQLLRGEIDRAVALQIEAIKFAGAADGVVIVVGDEQVLVVWSDDQAVGAIDFVCDDPRDFAIWIDAIDASMGLPSASNISMSWRAPYFGSEK
jgi:hypothetical protein